LTKQNNSFEVNREEEWSKARDLKVDIAMIDFPDQQDQRAFVFDLEEDKAELHE